MTVVLCVRLLPCKHPASPDWPDTRVPVRRRRSQEDDDDDGHRVLRQNTGGGAEVKQVGWMEEKPRMINKEEVDSPWTRMLGQ